MEITRAMLKAAFPGESISIRKVSFSDLARSEAYTLHVTGIDSPYEYHRLRALLGDSPTYRGGRLLHR